MNEPKQQPAYNPFHIGMRSIKTAFAAALCAALYFLIDRNPTFACIGAIFGMGSDMGTSKLGGGNRLFGTIIGGLLGMGLFRIYIIFHPEGGFHPMIFLLVFIGVIFLISISVFIKWGGAIQPGGVMLCIILFNTPVETYISYSLNRIIDTGIGVVIALLINWIFPQTRWRIVKKFFQWNISWSHGEEYTLVPISEEDDSEDESQEEDIETEIEE